MANRCAQSVHLRSCDKASVWSRSLAQATTRREFKDSNYFLYIVTGVEAIRIPCSDNRRLEIKKKWTIYWCDGKWVIVDHIVSVLRKMHMRSWRYQESGRAAKTEKGTEDKCASAVHHCQLLHLAMHCAALQFMNHFLSILLVCVHVCPCNVSVLMHSLHRVFTLWRAY